MTVLIWNVFSFLENLYFDVKSYKNRINAATLVRTM